MQARAWLAVVAVGAGTARAAARAWTCDDAWISFRYARNLLDGHGLVFNPGERVEGYTNFLWTLLCAGAMRLGASPERFAELAGVLAFGGTLALLAWAGVGPLPVAAGALAALAIAADFATSGLETSLFTLLLTATALAAERSTTRRGDLAVGGLASLALLTRPEGALVGAMAVLALAVGPGGLRRAAAATAPLLLVGLGWGAWKLHYYGDLLPNTFHAKAGEGARWGQGLVYLGQYLRTAWPAALGLGAGLLALPGADGAARRRRWILRVLLPALYGVHVARVGGDFMFGRFLVPITPLLLLSLEEGLARLGDPRARHGLGLLAVLGTLFAWSPQELALAATGVVGPVDGVIDERAFYADKTAATREQIAVLAPALAGLELRIAYFGAQAELVYGLDPPYALEGEVGLTDAQIARLPSPPGARVGHGPKLTMALARERGVDLLFDRPPAFGDRAIAALARPRSGPGAEGRLDFGRGVTGWLVRWDPALVEALRARGVAVERLEGAARLPG